MKMWLRLAGFLNDLFIITYAEAESTWSALLSLIKSRHRREVNLPDLQKMKHGIYQEVGRFTSDLGNLPQVNSESART